MSKRIIYKCKKCGWTGSIIEDWPDIKPRRCPNKKKCKTSFIKSPEELEVILPDQSAKEFKGEV